MSTAKIRLVDFYFVKHFLAFYAACIHKYEFSLIAKSLKPNSHLKKQTNKPETERYHNKYSRVNLCHANVVYARTPTCSSRLEETMALGPSAAH